MGQNMLGMEGPDQQRIRRIVETPFRPRDVEERTQGMIPKLAHELIDGFVERGEGDLFREYCDPMSVRSLRFMLGLDEVPWEDILRWNEGMMPGLANFEGDPDKQAPADAASAALGEAIERGARSPRGRARRLGAVVDAAYDRRRRPHDARGDRREHEADAVGRSAGAARPDRARRCGRWARTRISSRVRERRSL